MCGVEVVVARVLTPWVCGGGNNVIILHSSSKSLDQHVSRHEALGRTTAAAALGRCIAVVVAAGAGTVGARRARALGGLLVGWDAVGVP